MYYIFGLEMVINLKVLKYKKSGSGKYKVFFDNGEESIFYEDVILKYNLLIKKEMDSNTFFEANLYNQECEVYYVALKSIQNRFRSVFELKELLIKKEYPIDLIEKAIQKLLSQGYLNDRIYARSYINNQIITTNKGPFRIERELNEKNVDSDIIFEELKVFSDDEQIIRINKLIEKGLRTNHSRGGVVLKNKIYQDIKNLGYEISLMNSIFSNYEFNEDKDIAHKEYNKLYARYSKKYTGYELEKRIREKMYQRGFHLEKN